MDMRTRLLAKLDSSPASVTLQSIADEYNRLMNLKRDLNLVQRSQEPKIDKISLNEIKPGNLDNSNQKTQRKCPNCGTDHERDECPARKATCHYCGIRKH